MENIRKRLITPLRKGLVYVNPMKQMLNYELMTDNEILLCVKKGYLSEKIFDWTEYNNAQKSVEVETPAMEPIAEETPAAESVEEKPIVEKPKRSSKKGSK